MQCLVSFLVFGSLAGEQELVTLLCTLAVCCRVALIIRIYHECEAGIEKFVPRITKWHRKACPVIMRDGFFYPILTRIIDSLSCSPLNT